MLSVTSFGSMFFIEAAKGGALRSVNVSDAGWRAPSVALISAATHQDADVVPGTDAGGAFSGFAPCEGGPLGGQQNAGNRIDVISGIDGLTFVGIHKTCRFKDARLELGFNN